MGLAIYLTTIFLTCNKVIRTEQFGSGMSVGSHQVQPNWIHINGVNYKKVLYLQTKGS